MAYADPQSVTINAVAQSLPRVGSPTPEKRGSYKTADGVYSLDIRQDSTAQRFRREVRLTKNIVAADPISAVNKALSASVVLVVDEPKYGFTDTELGHMTAGLIAWFSNASRDKLLGGEL